MHERQREGEPLTVAEGQVPGPDDELSAEGEPVDHRLEGGRCQPAMSLDDCCRKSPQRWAAQVDLGVDAASAAWLQRDLGDRVSESTRANYEALLRGPIFRAIGQRKVVDLRTEDIEDIEDMLLEMQELGWSVRYMRFTLNRTSRVLGRVPGARHPTSAAQPDV